PENLSSAIDQTQLEADDNDQDAAALVQTVRDQLRVDLKPPDAAGVETMILRWTGTPTASCSRLLNLLARRFVEQFANRDVGASEAAYAAAREARVEAETAVDDSRQRFESALVALQSRRPEAIAAVPSKREPTLAPRPAPGISPDRNGFVLLEQQLADLENRRQTLAERLMPEHPEMRALEAKIDSLRARLGGALVSETYVARELQPHPVAADLSSPPDIAATREVVSLAQALLGAQSDYSSAAEHERACWEALCAARNRLVAEIEPCPELPVAERAGWPRRLVASLTALLCGALVRVMWPVRRLTFSTAEEVRAATRLPVVVITRASLN
ncbi:MAG TPA: hypothetical protein VFI31_25700, partial [Pirellulales bacterium]|nr:hypothetical protein [Pirellulales bacterium]